MTDAQDIVVYVAPGVELTLPLDRAHETVWASQAQIEQLFGIDQSGVSRHIRNLLRDEEVDEKSNMQKKHIAGADRSVTLYSLDVILAVGYRAGRVRAIGFRGANSIGGRASAACKVELVGIRTVAKSATVQVAVVARSATTVAEHPISYLGHVGVYADVDDIPRIPVIALMAITVLIAMSDPKEKELMVALVVRMLSGAVQ